MSAITKAGGLLWLPESYKRRPSFEYGTLRRVGRCPACGGAHAWVLFTRSPEGGVGSVGYCPRPGVRLIDRAA